MTTIRRISAPVAALVAALLVACGGSGDEGSGNQGSAPPPSASATIDRAGGTLEAGSPQGGTLALTLPSDALATAAGVSVQGLPAEPGTIDRFAIGSGRQVLLQRATLRYTASQPLPEHAVLRWRVGAERFPLPTQRQGQVLVAQTGLLGPASGPGARALSARARQQRQQADTEPAELEVSTLDCTGAPARMVFLLDWAARVGDTAEAQRIYDELEALVDTCQLQDIAEVHQRACDALASATLAAQVLPADSYEALHGLIGRLGGTLADARAVGAPCGSESVDGLLEAKFTQFVDFLRAEFAHPTFAQVEYATARQHLRRFYDDLAICDNMGLGSACEHLRTTLFPEFFDRLREGVYRECRDRGDALPLATMYVEDLVFAMRSRPLRDPADDTGPYLDLGRFSYLDLEADLSHCRSGIAVSAFDGVPVQRSRTELAAGAEPGSAPGPIEIEVPREGSVLIQGTVQGLLCPGGGRFGNDRLVTRVNNTQVDSRALDVDGFRLDGPPIDLAIEQTMQRAGLDPATVTRFTIEVSREGDACAGLFSGTFNLYSIVVKIGDAPPLRAVGRWTGTISTEYWRNVTAGARSDTVELTTVYTVEIDFGDGLSGIVPVRLINAERDGTFRTADANGTYVGIRCPELDEGYARYVATALQSGGGIRLHRMTDYFTVVYRIVLGETGSCDDYLRFPSRYAGRQLFSDVPYPGMRISEGAASVTLSRTIDGRREHPGTDQHLTIVTHRINLSGATVAD